MDNEVGRAGFHVKHEFRASKRGAILDEMMRERIPGASERWAQQNPSIVLGDEPLNIALVNNGKGWFSLCKDPKKVLAYGEERLAKLSHRVKEPRFDPKKDKEWGGTKTSSMFVIHLPKTLCEEVKDFYPVLDDDGNDTGRKRSRWVARDRDEAVRYFKDVLRYLAEEVIPGGQEAILGADIQFSESTPHIQILADPFAPDPKHPGQLRSEFSRAYGQHRGVRDEKGKQIGGKAKLRGYQEGFRQRMVELGWPVELDVDPLRHDKTATKAVYGALKDQERALAEQEQNFAQNLAKGRSEIDAMVEELADGWENLYTERAAVESEREQVQKDKEQVRKQLDQASKIYAEAMTASSIPDHQVKYLAFSGANILASEIKKHVDPQTSEMVDKVFTSVRGFFNRNPDVLIEEARKAERLHGNELVRKRVQVFQIQEAQGSLEDDGMEF